MPSAATKATRPKPDADDEAAFNSAATEIGIVFTRQPKEATHLNLIMCLRCGTIWDTPKGFRMRPVGWRKTESPPRSQREFRFAPEVRRCFRCPNNCNAPQFP